MAHSRHVNGAELRHTLNRICQEKAKSIKGDKGQWFGTYQIILNRFNPTIFIEESTRIASTQHCISQNEASAVIEAYKSFINSLKID